MVKLGERSLGWGWFTRVVNKPPGGCREPLRPEGLTSAGLLKGCGGRGWGGGWGGVLLVVLKAEHFKQILAQPSLGTSQPAEVSHVITHPADKFHLLT